MKYNQIHKQLLFHWSGIKEHRELSRYKDYREPLNDTLREIYIKRVEDIISAGLRIQVPSVSQESDFIREDMPQLCFTQLDYESCLYHAVRYGKVGFGFTKKYLIQKGAKPVFYVSNKNHPLKSALKKIINKLGKDCSLESELQLLQNNFKLFNEPKKQSLGHTVKTKKKNVTDKVKSKDSINNENLYIPKFGGVLKNLEDQEWRILRHISDNLPCDPGNGLLNIIFPDRRTQAMAVDSSVINSILFQKDRPSVSLICMEDLA